MLKSVYNLATNGSLAPKRKNGRNIKMKLHKNTLSNQTLFIQNFLYN